MKIEMDLFPWTSNVTRELFPLFPKSKAAGFESIEVPIARAGEYESVARPNCVSARMVSNERS
jgi:hypothetical protein